MRQKDIQKNIREQITQPEKGQRNVNNNKQWVIYKKYQSKIKEWRKYKKQAKHCCGGKEEDRSCPTDQRNSHSQKRSHMQITHTHPTTPGNIHLEFITIKIMSDVQF